jgi:hypothetical protein
LGGHLWYGNLCSNSGQLEERSKDCSNPLKDLSSNSARSKHNKLFTFCLQDIDDLSKT